MDCQFRLSRIDVLSTFWVDCENREHLKEQVEAALEKYGWARKYVDKAFFRLDVHDDPIIVKLPANLDIEIERVKKLLFDN